ncbi:hypothetical protein llap_16195 [Limosa lapponica baueri]|uniref:Uncharacterized protein n=1 Tax=Limosa lapponica baueri TaxID=1758121 RepID=A0A2I0TI87_LIMLA|nr:hypothetical protein llap_16195 [Limosa lapponica baueri]
MPWLRQCHRQLEGRKRRRNSEVTIPCMRTLCPMAQTSRGDEPRQQKRCPGCGSATASRKAERGEEILK